MNEHKWLINIDEKFVFIPEYSCVPVVASCKAERLLRRRQEFLCVGLKRIRNN